jgi:hypothetical protein
MINSRHILNLSIELIIKPQALDKLLVINVMALKGKPVAWGGEIFRFFKKIVFKKVLKKF